MQHFTLGNRAVSSKRFSPYDLTDWWSPQQGGHKVLSSVIRIAKNIMTTRKYKSVITDLALGYDRLALKYECFGVDGSKIRRRRAREYVTASLKEL